MKSTKYPNESEILREAEKYSELLSSIDDAVIAWAVREKLLKDIEKDFRKFDAFVEEMPEEWQRMAITESIYAAIFTKPALVRKFSVSPEASELPDKARRFVSTYRDNPWTYRLVSPAKRYHNGIFETLDRVTGEKFLYRSPSMQRTAEDADLYLVLSFESGPCAQTMGIVHSYSCFDADDFNFLSRLLVKRKLCLPGALYGIINRKPLPFMLFDRAGGAKRVFFRNEEVRHIEATVRGVDLTEKDFGSRFEFCARDGSIRIEPDMDKPSMGFGIVYHEKDKRLAIHASTRSGWAEAYGYLVSLGIDAPEIPDFDLSVNAAIVISRLLPGSLPLFEKAGEEDLHDTTSSGNGDGGKRQVLDKVNLVLRETTDLQNRGLSYDIYEIGKRHGLGTETIEDIGRIIAKSNEKYEKQFRITVPGGFDDFVPPPPADRHGFINGILLDSPFVFVETDETRDILFGREPVWRISARRFADDFEEIEGLPELLMDAAAGYFEAGSAAVLGYTFLLLFHYGNERRSVRDYAVEYLKTFWQVSLASKAPDVLERFVRRYRKFLLEVLLPFDIMAADNLPENPRKEDFSARAGEFFTAWARMPKLLGTRR